MLAINFSWNSGLYSLLCLSCSKFEFLLRKLNPDSVSVTYIFLKNKFYVQQNFSFSSHTVPDIQQVYANHVQISISHWLVSLKRKLSLWDENQDLPVQYWSESCSKVLVYPKNSLIRWHRNWNLYMGWVGRT